MSKITKGQREVLNCLTSDFIKLSDIKEKYIRNKISSNIRVPYHEWSNYINNALKSLVVKNKVEHKKGGFYKLKPKIVSYEKELLLACEKLIESFGHYDLELCEQEDLDNIKFAKDIISVAKKFNGLEIY